MAYALYEEEIDESLKNPLENFMTRIHNEQKGLTKELYFCIIREYISHFV